MEERGFGTHWGGQAKPDNEELREAEQAKGVEAARGERK